MRLRTTKAKNTRRGQQRGRIRIVILTHDSISRLLRRRRRRDGFAILARWTWEHIERARVAVERDDAIASVVADEFND
jgi:hypothetical protein